MESVPENGDKTRNVIVSQNNGTWTSRYLYVDHIGSTDAITNASGTVLQRFTFDPWGKKTSGQVISPVGASYTLRGFTGHESVEEADIIHMNGRIYDSTLGRFLQADPFIQAPKNTQSLNRYSYVLNNPLTLTDPSGYFSMSRWWRRNEQAVRTVAAIAVIVATGGAGATFDSLIIGGFVAGGIQTGTIEGAAIGAFTAGLFNAIGGTNWHRATKAYAHGVVAGTAAVLQGGKFGHGFVSAWFGKMVTPHIMDVVPDNVYAQTATLSIIGGSVSFATGGKFGNGAVTTAMQFVFNELTKNSTQSDIVTSNELSSVPEDGYELKEQAAREALKIVKSLNREQDEYGGGIIKVGKRFWFTKAVTQGKGYGFSAEINVPKGSKLVAIYHSHPEGLDSNLFSSDDTAFAESNGVVSFIGVHQTANIRYYDPNTMKPRKINRIRKVSRGKILCRKCF